MRKIITLILAVIMLVQLSACAAASEIVPTASPVPSPEPTPSPIYASELEDGEYEISVKSSSSMFRVVKCILNVDEGSMTAAMTMSGNGYGMLYMGTGEEALVDSEESYIPFVLDESGAKTFTVPVAALNMELDCTAWSIRKEKWYDRVLVFKSEGMSEHREKPEISLDNGAYSVEVTLSGGTGRAEIASPAELVSENGELMARIVWSSPFYEYMLVNGERYEPLQDEGNSTFLIPIVLDEEMKVSASTIAMSQPYLIDYSLYFDSATIKGADT